MQVVHRRLCRLAFAVILSSSQSFAVVFAVVFVVFHASFSHLCIAVHRRRLCHHRRHSPSSLPSFCHLRSRSPSSSPAVVFTVFAVLCRRLCQLFVSFAVVFVVFDASFSHLCRPSPSYLSSSPSFAVVFAVLRRRLCRLFVIFAVVHRRLRRRFCRLPVVRCHLCCPCCRFCRLSLRSAMAMACNG